MKKIIFLVISLLALVVAIYLDFSNKPKQEVAETRTYDTGYEEGKSTGQSIGYDAGHDDGYDEGYDEGYDNGYEYGHGDGRIDGYSEGYGDGHADGTLDAYLSLGEIDLAFQYAVENNAWIPFVPSYNEHIYQVYVSYEERDAITEALIDICVHKITSHEKNELLIAAFGEDLFIRNGIIFE